MDSTASAPGARAAAEPIALPLAAGTRWLLGAVVFAALLYYLIAIDQGALSIFGNDMHIHEFVHDARHLLSFACH